jgi:ferritin-like metal-binding protein YciE
MTDEVLKGAMSGYVFESVEIAAYTSLVAVAELAGDHQTKRVCEEILAQEAAMSLWLLQRLPEVTKTYLARSVSDSGIAKH